MTRLFFCFLALIALGGVADQAYAQKVRAGEYVAYEVETNHPYARSGASVPELTRVDVVSHPGATFISIHFSRFDLARGDFVVISSPDESQQRVYTDLGRDGLGRSEEGFFATHVKGDVAIVELYTAGAGPDAKPGYGYAIDFIGRGYNNQEIQEFWDLGLGEEMELPEPQNQESLCTSDDTLEAKCYQTSEASAYDESRSLVRLLITKSNGQFWCTGWLLGCEGHVMTNEHCIETQSQASNTDFEFMAEGSSCATNCRSGGACAGTIEATGATVVSIDSALDYSLVLPDTSTGFNTDLSTTYGYMQLRASGAVLNERIYLPQHPAGWGKRIALASTYPGDPNGFPQVASTNEFPCSGGPGDVGYWADTQGGSSGSPVLGYSDNLVIALHHCRGSNFCSGGGNDDPNRGVPIGAIISDLGSLIPDCATGASCAYSINPGNANYTESGGAGSVSVSADSGCAWTAVSNDNWITVTSGAAGSGNGSVGYSVAANASGARVGSITIAGNSFIVNQDGATGSWVILSNDNFESGFGTFNDGGSDCRRSANDASFAHQGTYCIRLRDNSGAASSMFSDPFNLSGPGYTELRIQFWAQVVSFEGVENFFVEYWDGSSWNVVADFVVDVDFTENTFFNPEIIINSGAYAFPTNAQVRIRCDASGNGDRAYFDEVILSAR